MALADIPLVSAEQWHETCLAHCASGYRIVALCAVSSDASADASRRILTVLSNDAQGQLELLSTSPNASGAFPSLTPALPQAQAFERDIYERHRLLPEGHPWLKPLRRHQLLEHHSDEQWPALEHPFLQLKSADVHEVAVGPVHAGIIEPGHFRFQCLGENVLHLEIQLGYQSRGAEQRLLESKLTRQLTVAESIAGDTAIGHSTAFCGALEGLGRREPTLAAQRVRGIALELERLSNHVGDLGAICGDVGYLPSSSWFGRLRGEFLNMLCTLTGNRFGRGLLVPGGVRYSLNGDQRKHLLAWMSRVKERVLGAAELMFESGTVCNRLEQTGRLEQSLADDIGLVGPAARACGCNRDVRVDHAFGVYRYSHIPVSIANGGDVMARAYVRLLEIQRSLQFVLEELTEDCDCPLKSEDDAPDLADNSLIVSLVECWRGEAAHIAVTDDQGRLRDYRVFDPSIHNWLGLALAMRNEQISDFPVCNKSFNLSYAGHDL